MGEHITKRQAIAALNSVKRQFRAYADDCPCGEPKLYAPGERDDCTTWCIAWDCHSPYEWAYRAFVGGFDDEMYHMAREFVSHEQAQKSARSNPVTSPKGVRPEPYYSWLLGLYKD